MKIFALDTSTSWMSLAVAEDAGPVFELCLAAGKGRGELLARTFDELLGRVGLAPGDLEAYVVGLGPGSFTGLRTGLAFVKGLGLVHDRPMIGVSTLEALAMNGAFFGGAVLPVIDAKKGQVFTARFRADGRGRVVRETEDVAVRPEELSSQSDGPVLVLGDGLRRYQPAIGTTLGEPAVIAPEPLWAPRAPHLVALARPRLAAGSSDDLETIVPTYVRHSDSELSLGPKS